SKEGYHDGSHCRCCHGRSDRVGSGNQPCSAGWQPDSALDRVHRWLRWKWLELLLEVIPQAATVAVIWNLNNPVVVPYRGNLDKVAAVRGVKLNFIDVRDATGLDKAFRSAKRSAQGVVVVCENLFLEHTKRVAEL